MDDGLGVGYAGVADDELGLGAGFAGVTDDDEPAEESSGQVTICHTPIVSGILLGKQIGNPSGPV